MTVVPGDDAYKADEDKDPVPLAQAEFNDLTRNSNLQRILLSFWVHVSKRTTFCWYRDREKELKQFFHVPREVIIILLEQNYWIDQINGLRNGEFLLTHPAEFS